METAPRGQNEMANDKGESGRRQSTDRPGTGSPWWDNTKAEGIVRVHQTATAWRAKNPMARSAPGIIREQVQQRYGIDVDALALGADGGAALNEAARVKTQAHEERAVAAGEDPAGQLGMHVRGNLGRSLS